MNCDLRRRRNAITDLRSLLRHKLVEFRTGDMLIQLDEIDGCVSLIWESGPVNWAYVLTGGGRISRLRAEIKDNPNPWWIEIQGLEFHHHVHFECLNGFTISAWGR